MRIKKFLSCLLSAALAFACLPFQFVCAEESEEPEGTISVWDGTYDTAWYDEEETEYHITTAAELAGLSTIARDKECTFDGKTIFLESDFDFNHKAINSIKAFNGIFEGGNHKINNIIIIGNGLFDELNGCIKNIELNKARISKSYDESIDYVVDTDSFAGINKTITSRFSDDIGIICGKLTGLVKDCLITEGVISISYSLGHHVSFTGSARNPKQGITCAWTVEQNDIKIGGCCGTVNNGRIERCMVDVSVYKSNPTAESSFTVPISIYDSRQHHTKYKDVEVVRATHFYEKPWENVGGISGFADNSIIFECVTNKIECLALFDVVYSIDTIYKKNTHSSAARVGGICGKCSQSRILNCATMNSSDEITSGYEWRLAGGIVADATSSVLSENVYSGKSVISYSNMDKVSWVNGNDPFYTKTGGVCGRADDCIIRYCYTNYIIETDIQKSNGGIIGEGSGNTLLSVYNTGLSDAGIVGSGSNDLIKCFYLSSASSTDNNEGESKAIAKNEANMKKNEFAERLGYPFVFVEGDYPKLAWELGYDTILSDVNLDDNVDFADVVQLQKALLTEVELGSKAAFQADLDLNGNVNIVDLTLLKRMLINQ